MPWDARADVARLEQLLEIRDRAGVITFCNDRVGRIYKTAEPYPLNPAKRILSLLRKWRFFEQMERLADAFIQTGAGSYVVERQYVQALLDQGHFTPALLVLERLIADTAKSEDWEENAEAR